MTSMYQTYFGFAAAPFTIAPDPRYLYMSRRHQEALAILLYGLRSDGGFVLLTGEVGAGKTTVCRCLLEQIPDDCDVAYLLNPRLTVMELLSTICDEFTIAYPAGLDSIKRFVDLINQYLLDSHARGRHAVLIIDEAQNLSPVVLEQIRLLTNLETNECKLLQILLIGQPELLDILARPELRQLAQRIVARYHLTPLDKPEVSAYVRHRLEVAGALVPLFPDRILRDLHKLSGGVPRVINVLCDRALLGTFLQQKERVDRATLRKAAREVLPPTPRHARLFRHGATAVAATALAGIAVFHLYQEKQPAKPGGMAQAGPTAPGRAAPTSADMGLDSRAPSASHVAAVKVALTVDEARRALALPPDVPRAQSQRLAFATLFHEWRAVYHDGQDPCVQAAAQGMQCRTLHGGLNDLRKLNKPVILHMSDDEGHRFYALLTELDRKSATFSFGAQVRMVSLAAVASQWQGEYTTLLRRSQSTNQRRPRVPSLAHLTTAFRRPPQNRGTLTNATEGGG